MTDQAGRRREREGEREREREGEERSLLRCWKRKRERKREEWRKEKGEAEGTERRNVDSIHRAQVEMVAHKYSYGIPEARKTSIPAEAHVCLLSPSCAFGNFVAGRWKSAEQRRRKMLELRLFRLRGVALCENINFPARIF